MNGNKGVESASAHVDRLDRRLIASYKLKNRVFKYVTYAMSLVVLLIIVAIFVSLFVKSIPAIRKFGFIHFILSTRWNPNKGVFGALPAIYGTLATTFISMLIAMPIAMGIAIFITQVCPHHLRGVFAMATDLLAAIPSIIYGMWGLFTFAPIMSHYIEPFLKETVGRIPIVNALFEGTPLGIDILTASMVLSIMIIPFISSIARENFELVPRELKESAYGMGATKWEVIKDVIIPYSKKGIMGGIIIAMGRALGETMAVAFVLGDKHSLPISLIKPATSITVTLANEFTEAYTKLYLSSLFYLALLLFAMSLVVLAVAKVILTKDKSRSGK